MVFAEEARSCWITPSHRSSFPLLLNPSWGRWQAVTSNGPALRKLVRSAKLVQSPCETPISTQITETHQSSRRHWCSQQEAFLSSGIWLSFVKVSRLAASPKLVVLVVDVNNRKYVQTVKAGRIWWYWLDVPASYFVKDGRFGWKVCRGGRKCREVPWGNW